MSQAHGNLREEFVPPFDTLKIDIHMSEPEYQIAGVDHERISSLEALQEDTFYSTANFVEMMGHLETGRPINYTGRIIPIVHPSRRRQRRARAHRVLREAGRESPRASALDRRAGQDA